GVERKEAEMPDDLQGLVFRSVSLSAEDDAELRHQAFLLRKPESDLLRAFVYAGLRKLRERKLPPGETYESVKARDYYESQVRAFFVDEFGSDGSSEI